MSTFSLPSESFRFYQHTSNDLVRFSWEARVEEYEDKTLEFYQKLYQGLEEKIMKLVEAVYPDWIQK